MLIAEETVTYIQDVHDSREYDGQMQTLNLFVVYVKRP